MKKLLIAILIGLLALSPFLAVNVDAAIATVWMGITWPLLKENRITEQRAIDIPFLAFALGRAAGGGGEFLDHQDHGEQMDMRVPVSECKSYTRDREFPPGGEG